MSGWDCVGETKWAHTSMAPTVENHLGIIGSVSGTLTEWRSTGMFTAELNEVSVCRSVVEY
jgi:hypothetical protein